MLDQNITLKAINTVMGLVKKRAGGAGSVNPLPGIVAESVANMLPQMLTDLNTLIGKYNEHRNLTSEVRGLLNAKLVADRASVSNPNP
ncbi:hypothetical protein GCM10009120_14350 [Sphingobacterium siyangense subsp. cladoniae]|jgi:hypothetical protein|uniref:hypothetical protein n=1 Tax=Sphingobacterium siyangense TaxID=459529 RepID=UPI0031F8F6A5